MSRAAPSFSSKKSATSRKSKVEDEKPKDTDETEMENKHRAERLKKHRERLAKKREEEERRKKGTRVSQSVDICFVIDATASMSAWITATKNHTAELMAQVKERYPMTNVRFAYVAYRDRNYSSRDRLLEHAFTEDVDVLLGWMNPILSQAASGSDEPEDCASGLVSALRQDWQADTKVLIWIGDSPNHGREWNSDVDNYPDDDGGMGDILVQLKNENIQLHFVRIRSDTDRMITHARTFYDNAEFQIQVHELGDDASDFLNMAIRAVEMSTAIRVSSSS